MNENKGFWYADWSFPIFVGLLSSGVFAGTHMYYLYGIGAFNEGREPTFQDSDF